jgi:hypothetical protein
MEPEEGAASRKYGFDQHGAVEVLVASFAGGFGGKQAAMAGGTM